MHDRELESVGPESLRSGVQVSAVSIGWTVFSSTVAVALGFTHGSLVLVAFGFTGVLDAIGSAVLVVHFRRALRHESISGRHEYVALRVVTTGLLLVGILTAVESVQHLVNKTASHGVPLGLVVAALSIVVLAVLSHRKRKLGRLIPSRALLADGWLSATGSLLALATVVGTGLTSLFGWWWADPTAAMIVALGAIGTAVAMWRS
ncbi:MAG: cation efflux protein [Acidimicrobiaceae bacterium]|nr:cation efflux protein [Acidimicrobiaceae bacterium]